MLRRSGRRPAMNLAKRNTKAVGEVELPPMFETTQKRRTVPSGHLSSFSFIRVFAAEPYYSEIRQTITRQRSWITF